MRIFFSVGEPSGDLHGANLIRRLRQYGDVECVGFGGPQMQQAGCELLYDLTGLAVMFLAQVLRQLRSFFRLIDQADAYFAEHPVDAVVLIDYPGFNWWIARKAKRRGIPVFYYGVPQMWAWAPWRVRKLRRLVDHVLCKLPFEVDWFQQRGCRATYVGHPFFDEVLRHVPDPEFMDGLRQRSGPRVALLPGSRDQEVANVLPILLDAAERIQQEVPDCHIRIASFKESQAQVAREQLSRRKLRAEVFVGKTPELMQTADVCLACSGSVSLELLHHRTPTVIVYPVQRWVMWAQALLLRSRYITLVNLMAVDDIRKTRWRAYDPDRPGAEPTLMPEYLTCGNPSAAVARRAIDWLTQPQARRQAVAQLDELARKYAQPGATARAADYLWSQLGGKDSPALSSCSPDRRIA